MKDYVLNQRAQRLRQSNIRAISKRCAEHNGINLGQGICDMPADVRLKKAAAKAVDENHNMYAPNEGIPALREAIAGKLARFNRIDADPHSEVMVTHGSNGAFICAVQVLFNPGDEVILIEPFYPYHKSALAHYGLNIKTVALNLEDFTLDFEQLSAAISSKTKGIVLCSPSNPCGKVFTEAELRQFGDLAEKHDLYVITDEIYEYITYPGHSHVSFASLEDYFHRTITISGCSKTYNITGWRLGYAAGPAPIIEKMSLLHDLIYVCPATPLQHAVLAAFDFDDSYYEDLRQDLLAKRDFVAEHLRACGFKVFEPQGAYYILAALADTQLGHDEAAVNALLENAQVGCVAGRSFYHQPEDGQEYVRFCYGLTQDKLDRAMRQMRQALGVQESVNAAV